MVVFRGPPSKVHVLYSELCSLQQDTLTFKDSKSAVKISLVFELHGGASAELPQPQPLPALPPAAVDVDSASVAGVPLALMPFTKLEPTAPLIVSTVCSTVSKEDLEDIAHCVVFCAAVQH
jgi:hypothetical protein